MSSLALSADGLWQRYDLPDSPPQYLRPGLWRAVRDAIADGVWYPEYHAAWHYDPDLRREAIGQSPLAREAAVRGIVLFPGSEHARELGRWRPMTDLAAELDAGTRIFQTVFGRPVGSVIAPDYTWDAALEDLWDSRDLRVIQAKREQRNPAYGRGLAGRVRKLLARNWARLTHADRCYLERNVRLEPVQAADPGAKVAEAVAQVAVAWDRGEPAIVEIHRVNLAHLDPAVAMTGQQMLQEFLAGCAALDAEAPLYLSDFEIAQLTGSGVSWSVRGTRLILHNVSHARRLVPVPAAVVRGLSGDGPGSPGPLMVLGGGRIGGAGVGAITLADTGPPLMLRNAPFLIMRYP